MSTAEHGLASPAESFYQSVAANMTGGEHNVGAIDWNKLIELIATLAPILIGFCGKKQALAAIRRRTLGDRVAVLRTCKDYCDSCGGNRFRRSARELSSAFQDTCETLSDSDLQAVIDSLEV